MLEPHTSLTYAEAYARARHERAVAFRAMLGLFRLPRLSLSRRAATA